MHQHSFEELLARFESPERDAWQKPDALIDEIIPTSGVRVVDLGAGSGYFTFRLAKKAERVLAADIDPRFIEHLEKRKSNEPLGERVSTRLIEPEDPKLEPDSWDLVLMVNVYHHVDDRLRYLERIRTGLRDHGKLVVVDFKPGPLPDAPPEQMRVPAQQARSELEKAGFFQIDVNDELLPRQYVITATERKPRSL